MTKKSKEDLFIIIGDHAISLEELGPIADMRIDAAMQAIIDGGFLGEELRGQPWYTIIKSSGMKLDRIPNEEETLLYALWCKYDDYLRECRQLSKAGQLTADHKAEIIRLRNNWRAAEKLSQT